MFGFEVKTTFASSPLVYLEGTGLSGSFATRDADFGVYVESTCNVDRRVTTDASIRKFTTYVASAMATALTGETIVDCSPPDCTFLPYPVNAGDTLVFDTLTGGASVTWVFSKTTDSGYTVLNAGTGPIGTTYYYNITTADISSTILQFRAEAIATD